MLTIPCMYVIYEVSMLTERQLIPTRALAEMVRRLRSAHEKRNSLILANGGVLSYENTVCLSNQPRKDGSAYPRDNVILETPADLPCPRFVEQAEGPAVIEVCLSFPRYCAKY